MKIRSIHLVNFRCFRDVTLEFSGRVTVVAGLNGAGKTAILDAVSLFLRTIARQFINDYREFPLFPGESIKRGADSCELSCHLGRLPRKDGSGLDSEEALSFTISRAAIKRDATPPFQEKNPAWLAERYKAINDACWPVLAYYAANRVLDTPSRQERTSEWKSAYQKAFNQQIDFSASLAWFIDKANEEARRGQRLFDTFLREIRAGGVSGQNLMEEARYSMPELSAVRQAIALALSDGGGDSPPYDEPYVDKTPPQLFICRQGHQDDPDTVEQLSDGCRSMLAIVMDIARRMAVVNEGHVWPDGQNVLCSPGVVLIDEVELHLHCEWQSKVLTTLTRVFPNVQFIVSTHSRDILNNVRIEAIRDDGWCVKTL